jgi:hypothetical protein
MLHSYNLFYFYFIPECVQKLKCIFFKMGKPTYENIQNRIQVRKERRY